MHIQTLWCVASAPGVMSLGFRLIFLCWPLEPDSQAEAVMAGSHHTAVSVYTSSWKNSFWKARVDTQRTELWTWVHLLELMHVVFLCLHVGVVDSPWLAALWRPPALWLFWWALILQLPPHLAHCTLSWAERPDPTDRKESKHHRGTRIQGGCCDLSHFDCACIQRYGDWLVKNNKKKHKEVVSVPYAAQES